MNQSTKPHRKEQVEFLEKSTRPPIHAIKVREFELLLFDLSGKTQSIKLNTSYLRSRLALIADSLFNDIGVAFRHKQECDFQSFGQNGAL